MGGTIQVAKENATADDTAAYMRFCTRPAGASSNPVLERLRITSGGLVAMGGNTNLLDSVLSITNSVGDCIRLRSNTTNDTFKYGTIKVDSYGNSSNGVQIIGGKSDSSYNEVSIGGGVDTGYAATQIHFVTAANTTTQPGTLRLKIDSDGAVNIGSNPAQATGTNTQNAILTVKGYPAGETSAAILALVRGNNTTSTSADHTMGRIVFSDKQAGEYAFIEGEAEANGAVGDTPGRLVFSTAPDNTSAPTEKLRINSAGHVSIIAGNLEFANGNGIDFSNVPDGSRSIDSDGNKLDDYEEGSFTPSYSTQSSLLTAGYVSQDGKYTKIGRFVHFQIYLRLSSKSGGSGHLRIDNLPFTSSSASGAAYGGGVVAYTNNWDNDAINRIMIGSGSTQVQLFVGTSSGTNVNAGAGNLNSDTQLRIFGSYQV